MSAIRVYCTSGPVPQPYVDLAAELGSAIAAGGHTLVSGGGNISMMGAVARATREGGGRTVGVIPRALVGTLLERAAHRGEIPTADETPRVAAAPLDLLRNEMLFGPPLTRSTIESIVDDTFLPLVGRAPKPKIAKRAPHDPLPLVVAMAAAVPRRNSSPAVAGSLADGDLPDGPAGRATPFAGPVSRLSFVATAEASDTMVG